MTLAQNAVRRTATYAAAAALAGGALLAGSGTATADTAVDITGLVTNTSGAALSGIQVSAYRTEANGDLTFLDSGTSDATGRYNIDDLETAGTNQVKLLFIDGNDPGTNTRALSYASQYLGNADSAKASPAVTFTAGASTAAPTEQLEQYAGVAVTVLNPGGVPVSGDGFAQLIDPQARFGIESGSVAFGDTTDDDFGTVAPAVPPTDGVVLIRFAEGDRPVKLLAGGTDTDAAGNDTTYLSQFLGGGTDITKAKTITPVAGQFQNYTIKLSNTFKPEQAPRIIGNTVKGKTLTADPGVWPLQSSTSFSYQWLRGSTVVSTEKTYRVTKADKKKKIRLVVSAANGDFFAQASVSSAKVGFASKVKVKKAGDDELRATVTVAKKKDRKKAGAVKGKVAVYDETGARVSKKAKLKGGSALLKVRDSAEGKLTVMYLGGGKLGTDTVNVGGGKGGKKKK